MGGLTNRFELRLSDGHLRRLKFIMGSSKESSKSGAIRKLIDVEYRRCVNARK